MAAYVNLIVVSSQINERKLPNITQGYVPCENFHGCGMIFTLNFYSTF